MKRVFWMAVGAAAATAGSRWTKRKASEVVEQYAPAAVGKRVATNVGQRVDAARRDGRAAMADTEARLRARLRGEEHERGDDALDDAVDDAVVEAEVRDPIGALRR